MKKLKELIEARRKINLQMAVLAEGRTLGKSLARDMLKEDELKNQIIEILMGSGRCGCTINRAFTCLTLEKSKGFYCSWCLGLEKVEKLMEGN